MEAGSGVFVAGPTGEIPYVPVPAALASALTAWHGFRTVPETRQWEVEATAEEGGYAFTVARPGGPTVLRASFDRRIELAASASSPSGRFTIFVQANNVATEVTVLDAARAERWTVLLPHEAPLAAFAISIHVDAREECIAISEQRVYGAGPETWYVDLRTRQVSEPDPGFVVAWFG